MQKFDIQKYAKAPDYIQKDDSVIWNMMHNIQEYQLSEEDLLHIPSDKLDEFLESNPNYLYEFSVQKEIELIRRNPNLSKKIPDEIIFPLLDIEIGNGRSDFAQVITNSPDTAIKYLYHLKEYDQLSDTLPYILKYMDDTIIEKTLQNKAELISSLTEEQQKHYAAKDPEKLKYIDSRLQFEFLNSNLEYIKKVSEKVQAGFLAQDPKNLSKASREYQLGIISRYPSSYKHASEKVKTDIYKEIEDPDCIQAAKSLLKKDIKNIRNVNRIEILKGLSIGKKYTDFWIFKDIKDESPETIKKLFLHTGIMNAQGKLFRADETMYGDTRAGGRTQEGLDDYSIGQLCTIRSLDIQQMRELIQIDSNYILPYLTESVSSKEKPYKMYKGNMLSSKGRCKNLFTSMFGEMKLEELETCIDTIYEKHMEMQEKGRNQCKQIQDRESGYEPNKFWDIKEADNIPLNHFKILFNSSIISSNDSEKIIEYFEKLHNGEDISDSFKEIIENAYGTKAKEILESRPELNVHTINSLEVFDNRILDNFELGFVHDLISYNIRDFSGFLDVVKDKSRLENFKTYYGCLTKIMGDNVETMQRTFSEFIYYEELLENVRGIELTDEQETNLISVLCSKENKYDINTLEELENYNEIAAAKSRERLIKAYENGKIEDLREGICEEFFGIEYRSNADSHNYGDDYDYIMELYDLQSETSRTDVYAEHELKILENMSFIKNEKDIDKLMELANALLQQKNIRNPVAIYSTINKMKEHQIEIFNETLLNVEKMEELCKIHENEEDPPIKKDIIDGVTKYTLNGVPYKILLHKGAGISLKDFATYEGQRGSPVICTRPVTARTRHPGTFGYTSIEKEAGIIANSYMDAGTSKRAKVTRCSGYIGKKINEENDYEGAETSFYRRYRSHKKINNKNLGGKRLPDVWVGSVPDEETMEFLRKYNIPIVSISDNAYKKTNTKNQETEKQNDSVSIVQSDGDAR